MDKERKHVSDAAWEAFGDGTDDQCWRSQERMEADARKCGYVMLTVAEHDELLALRAEVKRLEQRFRRITFTTNDDGELVLISEQDEDGQILRVMWERDERLRKGREDDVHARFGVGDISSVGDSGRDHCGISVREPVTGKGREDEKTGRIPSGNIGAGDMGSRLCHGMADSSALDPRLGLPVPDGDPCEPMSARSVYRWRAMV